MSRFLDIPEGHTHIGFKTAPKNNPHKFILSIETSEYKKTINCEPFLIAYIIEELSKQEEILKGEIKVKTEYKKPLN